MRCWSLEFWPIFGPSEEERKMSKSKLILLVGVPLSADSNPCELCAIRIRWNHFWDSIAQFYCWQVCTLGFSHFSFYSYQIQGISFDFSLPSPFLFMCRFFFPLILKLANTSCYEKCLMSYVILPSFLFVCFGIFF